MIIQVTRDIIVDDNLVLGEGALRVVAEDPFDETPGRGWKEWDTVCVPINVTDNNAGFVALNENEYIALPVLVGTVG
tara:strand:- start:206 stop:436 length:231 start_codon:yes stop_codon:yes gene_type:complete